MDVRLQAKVRDRGLGLPCRLYADPSCNDSAADAAYAAIAALWVDRWLWQKHGKPGNFPGEPLVDFVTHLTHDALTQFRRCLSPRLPPPGCGDGDHRTTTKIVG